MKKLILTAACLMFAGAFITAQTTHVEKRYETESGKVVYDVVSPEGKGTKTLYFDDYGLKESVHTVLKKRKKAVKDELVLLNKGKAYSVDLLDNTAQDISASFDMAQRISGKNMSATGKEMLEQMGGTKTGNETYLGKNCEVWEVKMMGSTKMLIYKGVPLKTESRMMGIKSSEIARSFDEGISVPDSRFQLPAGVKVKEMPKEMMNPYGNMETDEGMTKEDKEMMERVKNMSYDEFRKMVKKEDPDATDEEIKQVYEMMKQISK